jgi:hypothetical protein
MSDQTTTTIEPISPAQARQLLEAALIERLGAQWQDEWTVMSSGDFHARLTRANVNLDIQVDLLGAVQIEERPLNPDQTAGRLVAWAFLGASLIIALLVARLAGYL